jgi:hypothetical protein
LPSLCFNRRFHGKDTMKEITERIASAIRWEFRF